MSRLATGLKVAGLVGGVVLAGILAGWLHNRSTGTDALVPSAPSANPVAPGATAPAATPLGSTRAQTGHMSANGPASASMPVPLTNWEEKVEEILGAQEPDAEKAASLLEMFPRLPQDGQVEVAQHLSNLLPDPNYSALGQYLTNSVTPEPVLDVLMGGLLNRPNSIKLPWLLEVASQQQNPKAEQAKDLLGIFLEQDNGTDWSRWHVKLDQWLKENPD